MKKITNFENYSLIYLLIFPLFMGIGFSKIIKNVGTDAWISAIIGSILGLLINFLIKKLPNEDNKFFKTAYSIGLLVISTMLIGKLVSSIYLNRTPAWFVLIPGGILIYYTSLKGKKALYQSASLLIIIHLLLFLITALTLIPTINIDYFKPILVTSFSKIFSSALDFALISTTPMILVDNFKERYNYKVYLFSSILLIIMIFCTIGNLGVEISKLYRYPEYMVLKKVSILNFIENIENILFSLWIINIFTITSLSCINIKEETNSKILFLILILMIIIVGGFILNNYKTSNFFLDYYTYMLLGLFILFILSKIFRRKHNNSISK